MPVQRPYNIICVGNSFDVVRVFRAHFATTAAAAATTEEVILDGVAQNYITEEPVKYICLDK